MPVVAPAISHRPLAIGRATLVPTLRLAALLRAAGLLSLLLALLLPALLATLSLLTLLILTLLVLTLLVLTLLLSLLISLLLSVPARRVFIQPPPQRIQIIRKLPRAIEILFRTRTVCAPRTLLCCLQPFRKSVETPLDRSFIRARAALLAASQRLLALTNTIGNAIARERVGGVLQLPRGTLLSLARTHRTR